MTASMPYPPPEILWTQLAWMRGQRGAKVPMARYTSVRVGGPADVLVVPATLQELMAVMAWARQGQVPVTWLGNGTNVVVRARGIRGVVVSLHDALNRLSVIDPLPLLEARLGERVRLRAGAGVHLTRLLHVAMREGLIGLAFAVGIPGTIGGAIAMNAGTEGGSIWDVVESIRMLLPDGDTVDMRPGAIPVGYRFAGLPDKSVVLEATLYAVKGEPGEVRDEIRRLHRRRRESQPLAQPNAGSVFKNPPGERAGRLIDALGLKGYRIGSAQVSPIHANFIVNLGQASADEVLSLVDYVKGYVYAHTGVLLEEEIKIVGE